MKVLFSCGNMELLSAGSLDAGCENVGRSDPGSTACLNASDGSGNEIGSSNRLSAELGVSGSTEMPGLSSLKDWASDGDGVDYYSELDSLWIF